MNNIITDNAVVTYNGGGIYCYKSHPELTNNVITNNTASKGSGIFCDRYSDLVLTNNIITRNMATIEGGGIGAYWGSSPVLTYCDVWNNTPNNYIGCSPGIGCIETNPLFIDHPTWGPYYLDLLSPCIDAGNPSSEYNDIEDPPNPIYALPPSQGSTRNDMGIHGGPTPLLYYAT
jgi:hypothetical protein